jgi:hypothetical protein
MQIITYRPFTFLLISLSFISVLSLSIREAQADVTVTGSRIVSPGGSVIVSAVSDTIARWLYCGTGNCFKCQGNGNTSFKCYGLGEDDYSVTCLLVVSSFTTGGQFQFCFGDALTYTIYVVSVPEENSNCKGEGDPVGPQFGNFTRSEVDLSIPGRAIDLNFQRHYDSRKDRMPTADTLHWKFPLGIGWTHSYHILIDSLTHPTDPHKMRVYLGDGSENVFDYSASGYQSQAGNRSILKRSGGSPDTLILFNPDGSKYYFNQWRRINTIEDKNGNRIQFTYFPNSRTGDLVEIKDTVGRKYRLSYENNRIRRLYEGQDTLLSLFGSQGHTFRKWGFLYRLGPLLL